MDDVLRALRLDYVEEMVVDETVGKFEVEKREWWREVHRRLPRLERLYISGGRSVDMFLYAFVHKKAATSSSSPSAAAATSSGPASSSTAQDASAHTPYPNPDPTHEESELYKTPSSLDELVFPRLQELHLSDVRNSRFFLSPKFFEAFVDALTARRELDVPIKRLEIRGGEVLGKEEVRRLREVVGAVVWDGVEDDSSNEEEDGDGSGEDEDMDGDDEDDDEDYDMDEEPSDEEEDEDVYDSEGESDSEDWSDVRSTGEAEVGFGQVLEPASDSGNSDFEWPGIRGSRL